MSSNHPGIFTKELLSPYLKQFHFNELYDTSEIKTTISYWIEELHSGKLKSLKETEVKSRFILNFFGDILGYNYINSKNWNLREEAKSRIDGTRPDAALGYFSIDKSLDDVRVIVEMKDADTELDCKQVRKVRQTPVSQAFNYVSKMGGNCKWVVVCNCKEIRFYYSLDRSRYELFKLEDLNRDDELERLLFLFHRDRLLARAIESPTDRLYAKAREFKGDLVRPRHIVDEIFNCLKGFEGLNYIDPMYLSNLYPFNILGKQVYHYYRNCILSLNPRMYEFLNSIKIFDTQISVTTEYLPTLTDVVDYELKIRYIFRVLNHCRVASLCAIKDYKLLQQDRSSRGIGFSLRSFFNYSEDEAICLDIRIRDLEEADALFDLFCDLKFNRLFAKLSKGAPSKADLLEYGYMSAIVSEDNYRKSYDYLCEFQLYQKGKQDRAIHYFLSRLNIKTVQKLLYEDESEDLINAIGTIDLTKVVYYDLEAVLDTQVSEYLIRIKENEIIFTVQDRIQDLLEKVIQRKNLYDNYGRQIGGEDLISVVQEEYYKLFLHIQANKVLYTNSTRFQSILYNTFLAMLTSYQTREVGIKSIDLFFIREVILYLPGSRLRTLLDSHNLLPLDQESTDKVLEMALNFLTSYFSKYSFGTQRNPLVEKYMLSISFQFYWSDIFDNLGSVLARLDLNSEHISKLVPVLINYLELEEELAHYNLKSWGMLLKKMGNLFLEKDLRHLLQLCISRDKAWNHKYTEFIREIIFCLRTHHHETQITDILLIRRATLIAQQEGQKVDQYLIDLYFISDETCKQEITDTFTTILDHQFNPLLYERLLRSKILPHSYKDYFFLYIKWVRSYRITPLSGELGSVFQSGNASFITFLILMHNLEIDTCDQSFKEFENLTPFESWLLNPRCFDYSYFKTEWLLEANFPALLKRIATLSQVWAMVANELTKKHHPELSKIYFTYFKGHSIQDSCNSETR